ncbi:MAG: hypothetical protein MJ229_00640 [bacterium]|nr:hypothetical protein [bacterium]
MQVNSITLLSNNSQLNSSKISNNNFTNANMMSKDMRDVCSFEGNNKNLEKVGKVAGKIIGGILVAPLWLGVKVADMIETLKEPPKSEDIDYDHSGTSMNDPYYMP